MHDTAPLDAILLVSFGGPEHADEVVPFLENVTRGKGIPKERLVEVGEHYFGFGGRSPINDANRALMAGIESDLREHGVDLPVYWGNRNWRPYLADTLRQMTADGVRRAAAFVTSAYSDANNLIPLLKLGAVPARDAGADGGRRAPRDRVLRHERVLLVLRLPPVPRGPVRVVAGPRRPPAPSAALLQPPRLRRPGHRRGP